MQAVILAGGEGTRLRHLFPDQPKALVPVAGKPFIQWQMEWLASQDMTDIHLSLGYMADAIKKWLKQTRVPQLSVTTSVEPTPLGTGGGLKFVEPFVQCNPFLVINGDSLLPNLDFRALEAVHERNASLSTIAVVETLESASFGTVEFDDDGILTTFREKEGRDRGWVNGGVYLLDQQALKEIEPAKPVSLETDVFPTLVSRGSMSALRCAAPLLDMGTPEGLQTMASFLSDNS